MVADRISFSAMAEALPVNGHWGGWQAWQPATGCPDSCTSVRTRTCDNPEPRNGGAECQGPDMDSKTFISALPLSLCIINAGQGRELN